MQVGSAGVGHPLARGRWGVSSSAVHSVDLVLGVCLSLWLCWVAVPASALA